MSCFYIYILYICTWHTKFIYYSVISKLHSIMENEECRKYSKNVFYLILNLKSILHPFVSLDVKILTLLTLNESNNSKNEPDELFKNIKKIESLKVWKKPKYNSLRNKCLVFYIYIDISVHDLQSLCIILYIIYIYIIICI